MLESDETSLRLDSALSVVLEEMKEVPDSEAEVLLLCPALDVMLDVVGYVMDVSLENEKLEL